MILLFIAEMWIVIQDSAMVKMKKWQIVRPIL
jgi:hypothetical protein